MLHPPGRQASAKFARSHRARLESVRHTVNSGWIHIMESCIISWSTSII